MHIRKTIDLQNPSHLLTILDLHLFFSNDRIVIQQRCVVILVGIAHAHAAFLFVTEHSPCLAKLMTNLLLLLLEVSIMGRRRIC